MNGKNPRPPIRRCIVRPPIAPNQRPMIQCGPPPKPQPNQFVAFLAPANRAPSIGTPSGGPASGLWSSGSPGTAPAARPTPPPPSGCVTASILADCLASCSGTIEDGNVGPVCGWTWVQGSAGNSIVFTPGSMAFNIPIYYNVRAEKAAPSPGGLQPSTMQFTFNEFIGNSEDVFYDFGIQDSAGLNSLDLFFDSTGFVYLQYGPNASAPFYNGTWIPTMGRHVVQIDLDAAGVPTLYIDGAVIALTLMGSQATFSQAQPGTISQDVGWNVTNGTYTSPARFEKFFVTAGALPPTTFCCP